MKQIFVALIFLILTSLVGLAQLQNEVDERSGVSDRLYFGGNFSLNFGNQFTFIEVSPLVGYRFTNRFSAGPGITYMYYSQKFLNGYTLKSDVYGYRLFTRYNLGQQIFAHAEFENLNLNTYSVADQALRREWVPGVFVGGGYFQPIGRKAGIMMMALYNLTYDEFRSPYPNPFVIRVGITGGF
jgi:hypothetical protein